MVAMETARLESEKHHEGKTALCYLCITFQVHAAYHVLLYITHRYKTARDDILYLAGDGHTAEEMGALMHEHSGSLGVADSEARSLVKRSTGLVTSLKV